MTTRSRCIQVRSAHGRRLAALGAVGLAAALVLTTPAAGTAAAGFPDPAPGGPAHPSEPAAEGPANIDSLDAGVRQDIRTDGGLFITFDRRSRTTSGEKPAAARRFVFLFDKSIRFNPEHFPTCTRDTIKRSGFDACHPESVVGTGWVRTYGQDNPAQVKVFNTEYEAGVRGVLITIPATGAIFENTLEPVSRPYRSTYRWAFDELIVPSSIPPEERPASSRFTVEFGATRQVAGTTFSFVETSAARPKPLCFGLWSQFVTGQTVLPTDCTAPGT